MITVLVSRECILEVSNDASRNRQVARATAYGQGMPPRSTLPGNMRSVSSHRSLYICKTRSRYLITAFLVSLVNQVTGRQRFNRKFFPIHLMSHLTVI